MVYSAQYALKRCGNCGYTEAPEARFCGNCGANSWIPLGVLQGHAYAAPTEIMHPGVPTSGTPTLVLPEHMPDTVPADMARALTNLSDRHVPNFAHVRRQSADTLHKNQVELAKLMVLLARERLFLLFHFGVFIAVNLVGFVLALKCYNEFIGDEMSRAMVACTPFWVFNVCALTCLIPIKGTKRSIARIKEQIAHQKFKVEFSHLL